MHYEYEEQKLCQVYADSPELPLLDDAINIFCWIKIYFERENPNIYSQPYKMPI